MRKFFFILTAIVAFSSCMKQQDTIENDMTEITFSPSGVLKATVNTKTEIVNSLASFYVCCVTGQTGSNEHCVFNTVFSGTTSFTGGQYWPKDDEGYKFYASNVPMTHYSGGPELDAETSTDVICAFLGDPEFQESNTLVFNHIFARLGSCCICAPDGYQVSDLEVSITPEVSGTYSLNKGFGQDGGYGWDNIESGNTAIIASSTDDDSDNGLFLIPDNYTITANYTLTCGEYHESFTKEATVLLLAGKINNISATLPEGNASEITFEIDITDWDTNDLQAFFE